MKAVRKCRAKCLHAHEPFAGFRRARRFPNTRRRPPKLMLRRNSQGASLERKLLYSPHAFTLPFAAAGTHAK
jgi:hypothetical protein